MDLVFFSAYPHNDGYKQRLHHWIPHIKSKFEQLTVVTAIMPLRDRLWGLIKCPWRLFRPGVEMREGVRYVTVFPVFPNSISLRFTGLYRLNSRIVGWQIKDFLPQNAVMGTCHPYMYTTLIETSPAALKFYDCPDIFEGFPWADHDLSIRLEKKLVDVVDICFGSSNFICQTKQLQFSKHFFPILNAVDYDFHQAAIRNSPRLPRQVRKRILYVGALTEWFDYDLYEYLLRSFDDCEFILIGTPSTATKKRLQEVLLRHQNLNYLGLKAYGELPAIIRSCDVGIVPFKRSKLIDGVSPLKFFEYAAHGLPVVSIHWAELDSYSDHIKLCRTKEEFVTSIQQGLQDGKNESQMRVAERNSWRARAEELITYLNQRVSWR